ncbi:MAG: insulinase family protein [Desulfovibrio sp.]|jgi:Zn-dependent M16 (insulinase) family peptidase|nr:insulinase family protein [Desulfovibrio sp.]
MRTAKTRRFGKARDSKTEHGFELLREDSFREIGGTARLWRHKATGAQLLSVINHDENKCFGVTFRTPPSNSTGVAHILEHSVLCGSRKYPVKEPFVELLKSSLQTFLNAFTFPDKTCYPVASVNLRDFYNLIDVYLDAVFHPRLSEDIFSQEGWHVEAEGDDAPWTFKGVVYNEMKGVYSSPDSRLAELSQQAVFPDTLYSLDSGGDPDRITDLAYADFCDFHRRYYHPSNARFFFWGDDPEPQRLARVNAELKGYGAKPVDSGIPLQPVRKLNGRMEAVYAATEGEKRALFTVNWLLGERGDIELALLMEMLEHLLEGLPGSPLRRALISSGLGEDTAGCGLETDLRQMYYSTGLKGVPLEDVAAAEKLVFDVLAGLASDGFAPGAVEAAVNSVEFARRENNSGRFPRGLAAMIQALSTWLYDGDPLAPLAYEEPLANIKARLAAGERVFENLLGTHFLENSHRVTVVLRPDESLGQAREEAERTRLERLRAACDSAARKDAAARTRRLQEAQLTPDKPEDLALIPSLTPGDLPRENTPVPCGVRHLPHLSLRHELPTNGIAYASVLMPIYRLPDDLAPLLPLFLRSLTECGTARRDFAGLGEWMAAKTGGLGAGMFVGLKNREGDGNDTVRYVSLCGKAVYGKIPDLFRIFSEILLEPEQDAAVLRQRLSEMLPEEKSRLEHGLQTAGNVAVGLRLRAHYTGADAFGECTAGVSYLESLRLLQTRLEKSPESVLADMERLRALLIGRDGALLDCTAETQGLLSVEKEAGKLLDALPLREEQETDTPMPLSLPDGEAVIAPVMVNYVGKAANIYDLGYTWHGSARVVLRCLRMGRLWETVRVRGGAYGASCALDRQSGVLVFSSYRDPNVDATLTAYDDLAVFLRDFRPDAEQLSRAIVGAVGDMDAYMLPDAKGARSLARYLTGVSDEERQRAREEMFATTPRHFSDFAEVLAEVARVGNVCVLGGNAAEQWARDGGWKITRLL